jgi:CBS domain-containing protein
MRRMRLLFHGADGAALIEFAIILGLVMISGAAAMLCLGNESENTFAALADWNGNGAAAPPAVADPNTLIDPQPSQPEPPRRDTHTRPHITIDYRGLTAIFAGVVLLGYVAVRWRRSRAKRVLAQIDQDRQIVERVDDTRFAKRQEILKVLLADPDALLENRLEVRHLMSTRLRRIQPKTTLDEMRAIIEAEHIRQFPVVSDKGVLVGIVCDRDLVGTQARTAADAMTRTLITVSPSTKLSSALAQIINRNLTCLPVMQDAKLVGLLTTTELVLTLQCALQLMKRKGRPAATAAAGVFVG